MPEPYRSHDWALKATFFCLPEVTGQKSTSSVILQVSQSALPPLTSNFPPKIVIPTLSKVNRNATLYNTIFIDTKSFRSHYGPGVDSDSNRNEYQEHFLGVKAAGA